MAAAGAAVAAVDVGVVRRHNGDLAAVGKESLDARNGRRASTGGGAIADAAPRDIRLMALLGAMASTAAAAAAAAMAAAGSRGGSRAACTARVSDLIFTSGRAGVKVDVYTSGCWALW
eukprot:g14310.t1